MSVPSLARFKTCGACGITKPLSAQYFHKNHKKNIWQSWCKICTKLYSAEYRRNNKAELTRKRKEYNEQNRELVLEGKRQSYLRNRDAILAKQAQDKERRRQYVKDNRERASEVAAEWRKRNPEKVKEAMRQWRERNPGRYLEDRNRRRARKLAAEHEPYTVGDINDMWHKQGGSCYYCGMPVFAHYHVDHLTPLSRGGTDKLENLCVACPFCNVSKKDKTEQEFADYRTARLTERK